VFEENSLHRNSFSQSMFAKVNKNQNRFALSIIGGWKSNLYQGFSSASGNFLSLLKINIFIKLTNVYTFNTPKKSRK